LVIRRVGALTFVRRIWREVQDDHLFTWGAALAYAWLFAIFPFLLFLLTLVPHLPQTYIDDAKHRIQDTLVYYLPAETAFTVWENIHGVLDAPPKGLWSIGLIVTIWAASGGINMTMTALDRCYEIERGRSFVGRRLVAIGITLVVATMIIAVLLLIPIGNLMTTYAIEHYLERGTRISMGVIWLWDVARYALAGVLLFSVVSIMYYHGISVRQKWRIFSPGSVFTIGVWIGLAGVFKWYVNTFGKDSYHRTYGTVGGVVVLLLFFYLDALVLMVGAEINSEIDYEVLGVERGCRDFTVQPQPMFAEQSQPGAGAMPAETTSIKG
jgi:membrane protein